MFLDSDKFDEPDPGKPSTHAAVTIISAAGARLARMITLVSNIDKVIEHFRQNPSIWGIQIYIHKSVLVGSMQCPADPDDTHYLWTDRMITHHRTPTRAWAVVDSLTLEEGCPHVLQSADAFVKFQEGVKKHHEAQQAFIQAMSPVVGQEEPPSDEELN